MSIITGIVLRAKLSKNRLWIYSDRLSFVDMAYRVVLLLSPSATSNKLPSFIPKVFPCLSCITPNLTTSLKTCLGHQQSWNSLNWSIATRLTNGNFAGPISPPLIDIFLHRGRFEVASKIKGPMTPESVDFAITFAVMKRKISILTSQTWCSPRQRLEAGWSRWTDV